jgi:hypothetical protein
MGFTLTPKVYEPDCTGDPERWPWVISPAAKPMRERDRRSVSFVGGRGPKKGWRDALLDGCESVGSASRRHGINADTLRARAAKAGLSVSAGLAPETWDTLAAKPVAGTGPKGPQRGSAASVRRAA